MTATLIGHDGACTPAQVGDDLARALAALLCRGLGHRAGAGDPCAACLTAGRTLAPPVGRTLFACRSGERIGARGIPRPLTPADYEVLGRSLALLETLAGTAAPQRANGAGVRR
ncbi:MAG: hypothetical protein ACREMN_09175 [Gemmatimonadales bacterium]